jgi:hypothetical protein
LGNTNTWHEHAGQGAAVECEAQAALVTVLRHPIASIQIPPITRMADSALQDNLYPGTDTPVAQV